MKTLFLACTCALSLSAPALAARPISYVESASYVCHPEDGNSYLKDVLTLDFKTLENGQGSAILLTNAKHQELSATKDATSIAFVDETGDLYADPANRGYIMFEAANEKQTKLSAAAKIGQGSYLNDRFMCEMQGAPRMGSLKVDKIECATTEAVGKSIQTIRFTLIGSDNPAQLTVADRIVAKPRNSILASFNENLSVSDLGTQIKIFGDSAGIDFATLLLDKSSGLKTGSLKLETEGRETIQRSVVCEVK